LTKLDRQQRLTIHKLHLLCLLSHIKIRNHWISNTQVRLKLRNLLSENTRKLLHPENTVIVKGDSREFLSPILRTRKFLDGLKAAMEYWAKKFRINKRGIHLRHWNEFYEKITFSDYDINITEDKFFAKITRSFNGSRDIAAQGFCALLRSVDVNARIVSSLQVVDYTSRDPWAERPANTTPQLPREALPENKVEECLSTFKLSPKKPLTSSKRIRFKNGAPTRAMTPAPHHPQFLDSAYPVYWVEAYDCASQRWVSIDPCSKKIVEVVKYRSKLEPPLNDPKNTLSYVVAFDDQGFARDVTRRYTQFYNTKTRKKRVTNLGPQGKEWWEEKVMKACFEPKFQSDIDQLEVAELNNREIQEKLPTNIQDFKNHPIFVLERHLKQSEVLMEPRIPCGTLAVTSGRRVEKIFKRKDVRAVKSALTWYQLGKIIKPGQQPLKMVKRKKFTRKRSSLDDAFDEPSELEDNLETGLYSIEQTELYVPPPVENGIVPKNPFGNLDVYVPTMIPKGGIHLLSSKFPRVVRAAQELEIDYAPAVVGFDFGGSSTGESRGARVANPKIDGIIVPVEHAVSVVIICKELDKVALKEEKEMREAQALGKWRRYFSAIAIKRRLD
ncbi:Rad4-domain-containing protein, partial [Nadsonia fulvescens var. elongata DSM 6958]